MADVTPLHILQVGTGHWPARTLQVAVKLDLFSKAFADGGMTAEQFAPRSAFMRARCRTSRCAGGVGHARIARETGANAIYANTPETGMFLDRASLDTSADCSR